ncbi:MAG: hypothetical protein WD005_06640 [Haliea sp.]
MTDFYATDALQALAARAPQLRIVLVAENLLKNSLDSEQSAFHQGRCTGCAGRKWLAERTTRYLCRWPPAMLRALARALDERKVGKERVHMDSFGI